MSEVALPLHRAWNLWLSRWNGNATVQLKARFDTIQVYSQFCLGFQFELETQPIETVCLSLVVSHYITDTKISGRFFPE